MKKSILFNSIIVICFQVVFVFSSCKKENSLQQDTSNSDSIIYFTGAFIANEGDFGKSNSSVSYYSYKKDTVTEDIFTSANNRSLGDVLQSICVDGNNTYLVVNSSNKIEVVSTNNFKQIGVIDGVGLPRYMTVYNNKGFLSCWTDSSLKVIDLNNFSVINSIKVGTGPEKMIIYQNKLFVTNCGGYSTDSTLSIIDLASEKLINNVVVGYNPIDIVIDKDKYLWIVCFGKEVYDDNYKLVDSSATELVRFNPSTYLVDKRIKISDTKHASNLEISPDGSTLYFGGGFSFGAIFKLSVSNTEGQAELFCNDFAYGFNVNPANGEVFVLIVPTFTDAGILKRYNANGDLLGTYETGIGPNSATFVNN